MNWLKNLWESGNLGTVETEVEINNRSIINVAIAVVVVAVIVILIAKFAKKV